MVRVFIAVEICNKTFMRSEIGYILSIVGCVQGSKIETKSFGEIRLWCFRILMLCFAYLYIMVVRISKDFGY